MFGLVWTSCRKKSLRLPGRIEGWGVGGGDIPKLRRKPPLMQAGQGMYMQDKTDPHFLLNDQYMGRRCNSSLSAQDPLRKSRLAWHSTVHLFQVVLISRHPRTSVDFRLSF